MNTLFILLWLSLPVIMLVFSRDGTFQVSAPGLYRFLGKYLWFHAFFCLGGALFGILAQFIGRSELSEGWGNFFGLLFALVVFLGSGLIALYWLAFQKIDLDNPDKLPFGVKLWALFSKQTMYDTKGNVVPKMAMKMPFENPADIVSNKINTILAKQRTEDLKAESEYQKAQEELIRKTHDLQEQQRVVDEMRKMRGKK